MLTASYFEVVFEVEVERELEVGVELLVGPFIAQLEALEMDEQDVGER